jgi:hypothetical protein
MISLGGPPRSCISPTNRAISLPSFSSEYDGFRNVSRICWTRVYWRLYLSRSAGETVDGGEARYPGY